MITIKPTPKASIEETLNQYGRLLIKTIPMEDCIYAYGPLFVDWYKKNLPSLIEEQILNIYDIESSTGITLRIVAKTQKDAFVIIRKMHQYSI